MAMASRASLLSSALFAFSSLSPANAETVWGAVVFATHGERGTGGDTSLTPLGANQIYSAGSTIRSRLIQGPANSNITFSSPISGISTDVIDNSQISVLTTDAEFLASSAQAFMQGLYPPLGVAYYDDQALLSNGTVSESPLGNYQYPNIEAVSSLDYNGIWVAGSDECLTYEVSKSAYLNSPEFEAVYTESLPFYKNLSTNTSIFGSEHVSITYTNAFELYKNALYQSYHNPNISISDRDLQTLRSYGNLWEYSTNTLPHTMINDDSKESSNNIRTIAGQTLAARIYNQMSENVQNAGMAQDSLSIMVGMHKPLLSFFNLAALDTWNEDFMAPPNDASTAVWELFSNDAYDEQSNGTYPEAGDLWVRFLFRNGTEGSEPLRNYPMFGRGNANSDMRWDEFATAMEGIMQSSVSNWCEACDAVNLYCAAFAANHADADPSSSSGSSSSSPSRQSSDKHLNPYVAGVIGAVTALAAVVVFLGGLAIGGGFRFSRREGGGTGLGLGGVLGAARRKSSLGGFKGTEKMASDVDVSLANAGVGPGNGGGAVGRHERMGSWEMGDTSGNSKNMDEGGWRTERMSGATLSGEQGSLGGMMNGVGNGKGGREVDDDGVSFVGREPTKVEDRV